MPLGARESLRARRSLTECCALSIAEYEGHAPPIGGSVQTQAETCVRARKFTINGAVRGFLLLTFDDVRLDALRRNTGRAHLSEKRLQMIHVLINAPGRLSFVDLVVLFHKCGEILEPDSLNLWPPIQS